MADETDVQPSEGLVERLRSREAMATPGPWQMQDGNSHRRIGTPGRDGNVCRPARYSEREPHVLTLDGERIYADLMLAIEARNALPELLATIERLQARVAELEAIAHESLYHLRLDDAAHAYHHKVQRLLNKGDASRAASVSAPRLVEYVGSPELGTPDPAAPAIIDGPRGPEWNPRVAQPDFAALGIDDPEGRN